MLQARSAWRLSGMALTTLALSGFWGTSHAALFGGDDEARRAILELRQRLEQSQIATRALMEQIIGRTLNAQGRTPSPRGE